MCELPIPPDQIFLSKEQFCQICHIGKRTAERLISEGLLPAIDTHKRTNRYLIARADIETYLQDREQYPEKYGYEFRTYGKFADYDKASARRMRTIAEAIWENMPDLLTAYDIAAMLGYRSETIYRWHIRFRIRSFNVHGKLLIPKESVLDFVESPEFHLVERKSKSHYDLIRRAYYEWVQGYNYYKF